MFNRSICSIPLYIHSTAIFKTTCKKCISI